MNKTKLYLGQMSLILQDLKFLLDNETKILNHLAKLNERRALAYASGRALLKYVLINEGVLCKDGILPNITYSKLGKPKFDLKNVYFNLSHSKNMIALSLGNKDLGVDIELCDECRLKFSLINRVLSDIELDCLNSKPSNFSKALFFTRQWTLRESLLKAFGHSIFSMDNLIIDPINKTIKAHGYPKGIIASFNINIHEYTYDNDKIYHLNESNTHLSNSVSLTDINFINSYLDCLDQDVKRSDEGDLYFQLSVFLELAYDEYNNLEQAVKDNLEIWLHVLRDNLSTEEKNHNNIFGFKQINYLPQAIFTVN